MSRLVRDCEAADDETQIAPVVDGLSREFAGRLKVAKANADTSPRVSQRHGVSSIPTLLLYRDGKEIDRMIGAVPAPQLRAWVERTLTT